MPLSEKVSVEVQFNEFATPLTIPKDISLVLLRLLQESSQNAVKYRGVRSFVVLLRGAQEIIELMPRSLISMRERIQRVHGSFDIQTQPGVGTTISARVPLQSPEYRAMAI
jgi:signal transduction histidine kinase